MLNIKQLTTLTDLKKIGLETPQQVVDFCRKKLTQSCMTHHPRKPNQRRHSKKHYFEIIEFFNNDKRKS